MKKNLTVLFLFLTISFSSFCESGIPIHIWKEIPSMKNQYSVMYMHSPRETTTKRPAVIVCPGGSYHHLGIYNEGYKSARWFSENGFVAFNLRYRTAEAGYHYPAMLQDIQRAIQIVRENAEEFNIDASKVGIIGYSAGGHLVTMAGAFHKSHDELKNLGINHSVSLRPDFVVPVYPVVSMNDELAHRWSRKSLLGKNQSQERKNEFSMELQIPNDMPPTYVVVCKDDNVVDYRNSLALYDALQEKQIKSELALYEWGKHGFGMLDNEFMKTFRWNEPLKQWLIEIGIIK